MAVKRNYRINLRNYGNPPAIMVSQYDENYDLVFEVYDGVVPATGLNAYTVKLVGRQPGNDPALKYEFTGTVSGIANNILSFTIDTTMTGRAGKGTAEIVILDTTNDVKFASFNLPVYVEKAAVPDDAIDADVERAQEIADEVQDIVDTAAAEVKGEAEAWAVGERDGEPVSSTDPTYENNAKYYAEQAQDIADSIGIDATLSISGKAADAKKTGDEISSLKEDLNIINKEESFSSTVAVSGTKTLDILYADLPFAVSDGSALLIDMGISGTCKVNVYLIKNDNTTVTVASNVTASRMWPSVKKADYKGMRFFVFSVTVATTFTLNIQSAESFEQETADNRVVSYAVRNAKARFPFVVGDINTSGGWAYSTYRLCTLGWQYTNESLLIVGNGKVKVYVHTADDSIGTNIVNVGWVTDTNGLTSYTIPANTYFILIVADINGVEDSTNVITDVASSRIYRGLEIRSAIDKTEEDDYIMDMVRSHIIASPQGVKSVAHQGYSLTGQATGRSTLSSVVGAYRNGFADIETDIKFSSDNVPVLSHDATFVDGNTGTTITISQHTASELQTYKYFGEKIATFDEFMMLSKMLGLTVWIDQVGVADSDADNRWPALFAVVTKYQMQDRVIWLTMTEAHINRIVAYYPKSRFAFLGSDEFWTNYAISQAQLHTEVKDIIIDLNSANFTPSDVQTIASTLPSNCRAGIYTVDDKDTYKSYMPFVDAITSNKISAPMIAVQVAESYDAD